MLHAIQLATFGSRGAAGKRSKKTLKPHQKAHIWFALPQGGWASETVVFLFSTSPGVERAACFPGNKCGNYCVETVSVSGTAFGLWGGGDTFCLRFFSVVMLHFLHTIGITFEPGVCVLASLSWSCSRFRFGPTNIHEIIKWRTKWVLLEEFNACCMLDSFPWI